MAKFVKRVGSQLHVQIEDVLYIANPTTNADVWKITSPNNPVPPKPQPGGGKFSWPFNPSTDVTSEFGARSPVRWHEGIDFGQGNAVRGADIHNIGAGTIHASVANSGGYGPYIDVFLGHVGSYYLYARYGHLDSSNRWSNGQTIAKGALIATVSDGGVSDGANLHLETHVCVTPGGIINDLVNHAGSTRTAINPRTFMARYGDGGVLG